eukprot:609312-Amphidinium_carterae.2
MQARACGTVLVAIQLAYIYACSQVSMWMLWWPQCTHLSVAACYPCQCWSHWDTGTSQLEVIGDETAEETMQRFILEQLPGLAAAIEIVDVQTVIEMGASASYGITTKYIKTIHTAKLAGEFTQEQRNSPQHGFQMGVGESLRVLSELSGARADHSYTLYKTASSLLRKWQHSAPQATETSAGTTGTPASTAAGSQELVDGLLGPQGKNRLFAVLTATDEHNSGEQVVNHKESQQTDGYDDGRQDAFSTLHLYSWIDKDEFHQLRGMPQKEVEEGFAKYAAQHFSSRLWLQLLNWRVKPGTLEDDSVSRV